MAAAVNNLQDSIESVEYILSVSWEKGKLACSYYKMDNLELFVTYEALDPDPEYPFLYNLFRQLQPQYVLASGPNFFLQFLMKRLDIPLDMDLNLFKYGSKKTTCIQNFSIFPRDEKTLNENLQRILSLYLPGMSQSFTQTEKNFFLQSLLPLDQPLVIRSLGNLLIYIDTYWRHYFHQNENGVVITDLKVFFMESQVLVDESTLTSLQIFSANKHHPSGFKKGLNVNIKDGHSVFNLLNRCCSSIGVKHLQTLLYQPTRNIRNLNMSYNTIEWCMMKENYEKLQTIRKYLKNISDIGQIFKYLRINPNHIKYWQNFKKTVYSTYMVSNYCKNIETIKEKDTLLAELSQTLKTETSLKNMLFSLDKVVDLEEGLIQNKFIVKFGLDDDLDKKKETMINIQDSLQEAVQKEMTYMPSFVNQIFGYYIPEIGYVIQINMLQLDPPLAELENQNLTFLSQNENSFYFKTALCDELNLKYGHLYSDICEHESRICERLLKYLFENLPSVQTITKLCAKLDCMISFAEVARDISLVKPEITNEKVIEISKGRHILAGIKEKFIPNDTNISLENKNLITILCAPNSSGKSIYIKQIALIAYLAHVGCFVPASSARICLLDSIYSRIHSPESVYTGSSSFLIDLQQMGNLMTHSKSRSLILIDEFGKGTNMPEGQSLLVSCIENLSNRDNECPFTFISTHFTNTFEILKVEKNINFKTFKNFFKEDGTIVSTFKLENGSNITRYALKIDGVKQFLDKLFSSDLQSEVINNKMEISGHRSKVKFAFDTVKAYLTTGSAHIPLIKESFNKLLLE